MDKKVERVISLYQRILDGDVLVKAEEAARYGVTERSIQRDLDDIRAYCAESMPECNLVYSRAKKGYILERDNVEQSLTNSEILTVCKILLESRSLMKEEMYPIIDKLLRCCVPYGNLKRVEDLIANEKFHYLEPHHGKTFIDEMWNIGTAVHEHKLMRIYYNKIGAEEMVSRLVQPVGIMFSEYYFYLCAYMSESEENPDKPKYSFPTIYRIDRIKKFEILEQHFRVPYAERFQEGEFRKKVQFMFGGELRKVTFLYKGRSLESVLDRLPTAAVQEERGEGVVITAEVYGNGIEIWLRSQGDDVELMESRTIVVAK